MERGGLVAPTLQMILRRNLLGVNGRADYLSLFRRPALWQLIAAAAVSLGQIFQFFALSLTTVTAVAIIGSVEMFIAAWLSALLLKSERKPGPQFLVASILALLGTLVITLG